MNDKEFCVIYIGVWTYSKKEEKLTEVNGATRDDDVTALLVYDLQNYFRGLSVYREFLRFTYRIL